jgi:hypothetical protein
MAAIIEIGHLGADLGAENRGWASGRVILMFGADGAHYGKML